MLKPYVVKVVSKGRARGKTLVASKIVEKLAAKGYKIGVVKHAMHVDIEDKDSHKFVKAGAYKVIVSSGNIAILYLPGWVDDLEKSIAMLDTPIIVVEGFKGKGYDTILVAREEEDLELLKTENVRAVVVHDKSLCNNVGNVKCFSIEEVDLLAEGVEAWAREWLLKQLPGRDCGMCGYSSCRSMLEAILRGIEVSCPVLLDVQVVVDGKSIHLNPFVKSIVASLVTSLVKRLKGVPPSFKNVEVKVRL